MRDGIQVGDIVMVNFHAQAMTLSSAAEVLHMPNGTGDTWGFKDIASGVIHYISEPCSISLKEQKP